MNINRRQLKVNSRFLMSNSKPSPGTVSLVVATLFLLVSVLSGRIMSSNISVVEAQRYLQYVENGYYEGALNMLSELAPSPSAQFINFLLNFVLRIVSVGFIIFLLNTIRHTAPVMGNLLDGFGILGRYIVLVILQSIFITLWSLLFVIPGIIAAFRYRMALYILIDHPEMSPLECIRESKRMMAGHKWELFCLDFSFIGWTILENFSYIGPFVLIYTLPYKGFTYALYYEALCGKFYNYEPFRPNI